MREFVAKKKKVKVTIEGVSYEMRYPSVDEKDAFDEKSKIAEPGETINNYKAFFATLGLPEEVSGKMDADDFIEFIGFLFNPKSQGPQT